MAALALPRRRIALAALALATLSLSACFVKLPSPHERRSPEAGSERTVLEPTLGERRSASDSEYPPVSVDANAREGAGASEARDPERSEAEPDPALFAIEPYPPNPRCYAAGRYIPAPPMCPSL